MSATSSTCRWNIPMQAFGLLQCFLLLSLTIIFLQLPEVFFISSGTIFLTYSRILCHRLILASPLSATCTASGCQILGGDLTFCEQFFCVLTYQCISCLILQLSIKWLVLDLHCGTQRTVGTCSCSMCLSSCLLENLLVWIPFPHSDTTESHLFRLRINESMSHSCRLYSLMLSMHRSRWLLHKSTLNMY